MVRIGESAIRSLVFLSLSGSVIHPGPVIVPAELPPCRPGQCSGFEERRAGAERIAANGRAVAILTIGSMPVNGRHPPA